MANMIQAAAKARARKDEDSPTKDNYGHGSPVKSVFGALGMPGAGAKNDYTKKTHASQDVGSPPKSIEDVPFRRQDRRVLNSRKKRLMDRKLIRCILLMGLILVVVGGALIALWWQVEAGSMKVSDSKLIGPFGIMGGVLIFFGILLLLFSIEICIRLRKNAKRVKDPGIDKLKNLHELKHWVEPELIPYGWGNKGEEDHMIVFDEHAEFARSRGAPGGGAIIAAAAAKANRVNSAERPVKSGTSTMHRPVTTSSSSGRSSRASTHIPGFVDMDNSDNEAAADAEVANQNGEENVDDPAPTGLLAVALARRRPSDVTKDIFDDSLRFANVDRPNDIHIDRSSPTEKKQIRGEFMTEEERIANLFMTQQK